MCENDGEWREGHAARATGEGKVRVSPPKTNVGRGWMASSVTQRGLKGDSDSKRRGAGCGLGCGSGG